MKYLANPVVVNAYQIVEVGERLAHPKQGYDVATERSIFIPAGSLYLRLEENKSIWATPEQLSRINPAIGDYVVVQEDGYTYLNPRDVFQRKYSPLPETIQ